MRALTVSEALLKTVEGGGRMKLGWIEHGPHRFQLVVEGGAGREIAVDSNRVGLLRPSSHAESEVQTRHVYDVDAAGLDEGASEVLAVYHGGSRPVAWFTVVRHGQASDVVRHADARGAASATGRSVLAQRRPFGARVMPDPSYRRGVFHFSIREPHPIDVARWGFPRVRGIVTPSTREVFGADAARAMAQVPEDVEAWDPDAERAGWRRVVAPAGLYTISHERRHGTGVIETPHRVGIHVGVDADGRMYRTQRDIERAMREVERWSRGG